MTHPDFISEIEARLNAATPGPWHRVDKSRNVVSSQSHPICEVSAAYHRQTVHGTGKDEEFIAHAPQDLRRLIDYARELEAKLKIADEALEYYSQHDKKTNLYGAAVSQYASDSENYRVLEDKGTRAREALAKLREGK